MQKYGLMGGTFDPIHLGHLIVAETIRQTLHLNHIVFVPSGSPPHKKNDQITDKYARLNMVQLSIESNPTFSVSDVEIKRKGFTYTLDTLQYFNDLYPKDECYFILGADSMDTIHEWYDFETLFQLAYFVTVTRGKNAPYQIPSRLRPFSNRIVVIDTPFIELSSTEIRNRRQNNESIKYLVNEEVEKFIDEHHLYRK